MKIVTMKMNMAMPMQSMQCVILLLSRTEKADVVLHYIQLELFSAISWIVAAGRCLFFASLYSDFLSIDIHAVEG